jgi:hypothetical protein
LLLRAADLPLAAIERQLPLTGTGPASVQLPRMLGTLTPTRAAALLAAERPAG